MIVELYKFPTINEIQKETKKERNWKRKEGTYI